VADRTDDLVHRYVLEADVLLSRQRGVLQDAFEGGKIAATALADLFGISSSSLAPRLGVFALAFGYVFVEHRSDLRLLVHRVTGR
jgi:hypothetical protein